MKRRQFIAWLGSVATTPVLNVPLVARAQEQVRRVGLLMGIGNDAEGQRRVGAFRQALHDAGWIEGRNIRFEYRWGTPNVDDITAGAAQLIASQPDVILANSTLAASVLKRATTTIPVVFVQVADPVRDGIVPSLARPGGNVTGFTSFEYTIGGKWLETLTEVAPAITRVAVMHNPQDSNAAGFLEAIERVAPARGVTLSLAGIRDAAEVEATLTAFARAPDGGVLVLPTPATNLHRKLIFELTTRHRLPAVYPFRFFVEEGGLVSYGFDSVHPFKLAAGYVSRILKGEKPAELPVQAPTTYELVINVKTAKAIGLAIPEALLLRADDVIQ